MGDLDIKNEIDPIEVVDEVVTEDGAEAAQVRLMLNLLMAMMALILRR